MIPAHLPEFGCRDKEPYIGRLNWFCPLAWACFPGYTNCPAMPGPSRPTQLHIVFRWYSTVWWILGPTWVHGSVCQRKGSAPGWIGTKSGRLFKTCIASSTAFEGNQLGDVWRLDNWSENGIGRKRTLVILLLPLLSRSIEHRMPKELARFLHCRFLFQYQHSSLIFADLWHHSFVGLNYPRSYHSTPSCGCILYLLLLLLQLLLLSYQGQPSESLELRVDGGQVNHCGAWV